MKFLAVLGLLFAVLLDGESLSIRSKHYKDGPRLLVNPERLRQNDKRGTEDETEPIVDRIVRINTANHLNLYEGDIVLDELQKEGDEGLGRVPEKRNAIRNRAGLWYNRVVPYVLNSSVPAEYHSTIQDAINEFQSHTCLKFKKRTTEKNWVHIVHEKGCWSTVGQKYWRADYGQKLSLGPNCNDKGTVMHEFMHAVGFWHEQNRPDRNQYVEVLWENIKIDQQYNFIKHGHDMIDQLKVPYDYDSIMHYGRRSFSKNGQDTLRSILDPDRPIGQRSGFSGLDLREINTLYDCASNVPGWSSWTDYGPCDLSCKKKRQRFCASDNPAADCPGYLGNSVQTEEVECGKQECYAPINGHWSRWSDWTQCSAPCGNGTRARTRACDDPPPKYGGNDCVGTAIESKACILRRCGLGQEDCQFDYDGFCFWTNDTTNSKTTDGSFEFDWRRISGATPSSNTGPIGDHTTGTDHYLYLETSSPAQQGYKARLLSKTFPASSGRCLSFWYYMFGGSVGELSVSVKETSGVTRKIWTKQGNQGNSWKHARVSIHSSADYQIIFEGVRGKSFDGDIAIDDVAFKDGRGCYKGVGCYKDDTSARALPDLIRNLRSSIDWYNIDKTIEACAKLVYSKGYETFAIQYYGECYGSKNSSVNYGKYGPSSKCWAGVGREFVNYVYTFY